MSDYCARCGIPLAIGNESDYCDEHASLALPPDATVRCPFCSETIFATARKCRYCGEFLTASSPPPHRTQNTSPVIQLSGELWNPGLAAVLSFFIPGLGQMYRGKIGVGIAWLFGVVIGYAFLVVPGILLHIGCIVDAYRGNPARRG